ncbi:uridine kinase [Polychaeton citri CBS 116435]|uniref:Uridine kinase n=1 Tax=Polychaeton citri CBS 116435 TaxID=1314669 RepID=A0A9P4UKI1_9PEZI|nr:uridine kinase [Polychaeton citri CBS 116435]
MATSPVFSNESIQRAHYSPPWRDTSIIGVAGSSGSGKTSLAIAIIKELSLPWVVIMSMDSFYKPLSPEESAAAFRNEYDFDAPEAIDFDVLVQRLRDIKAGKKADIPVYSFEKHSRLPKTTTIYSPHVLILEGIFALHDPRVLEMLDLKVFAEADADLCLSRRLLRDVRERGRDIEGCIKQWFGFVKPNFHKYVEPQRNVADLIVPRGIENRVAISMMSDRVHKTLGQKSHKHQLELKRLGRVSQEAALSSNSNVLFLPQSNQVRGINTALMDSETSREDFIFYFDRLSVLLVERATENLDFRPHSVLTPVPNQKYAGLEPVGEVSAVVVLRGGSAVETGLKRVIPDCKTGRMLIQTNFRTGEPELHHYNFPADISSHMRVLVLDCQMSSGGSALMAVRVLLDHGVKEERIVVVTYTAGKLGLRRLVSVFPEVKIVVCRTVGDEEYRWVEGKYLGVD